MDGLEINFGSNSTWTCPVEPRFASTARSGAVIENWQAAVHAALSSPIEFPALDQALVPGDQLVLAVDPATPSLIEVVVATVSWFCDRGTPAANIRIVLAGDGMWSVEELTAQIKQRAGHAVTVEQHSFDNPDQLAYVAANEASDPIYLNRSLVDADVVIPISAARPNSSIDYFGSFGLFPLLSDRTTRGKFYSLPSLVDSESHAQLRAWAEQAAWWVGVIVAIQVIPAHSDQASGLLAGMLDPLEAAVQEALMLEGNEELPTGALTIAFLDGAPQSQSWLGFARSLASAQRYAAPGGAIVLVTQLSQAVGSGLNRLRDPHRQSDSIAKKLATDNSDDAWAASVLLQANSSFHVYLISKLRAEIVESLGMGAIADEAQLSRLIEQFESCTIVKAAQHLGA